MPTDDLDNILSAEALGELARKERRALLVSSLLGFAVSTAGLMPSEISMLGLKTSEIKPVGILWLIAAVIVYLLISFLFHALKDFLNWWKRYQKWVAESDREHQQYLEEIGHLADEPDEYSPLKSWERFARTHALHKRTIFAKVFILDLIVPYAIGIGALFTILLP